MGLVLEATCDSCEFTQAELRLGGTHEMIARHDVAHFELFWATCCEQVHSIEVKLGQAYPDTPCPTCNATLNLASSHRYRVATLKGETLAKHPCPKCSGEALTFRQTGKFI
ncbi:hypothetical protein OAX78_03405 [Planctomycetota bacterium]|nr:hypothetical protein [Planctomycetota bacterium]